MRTTMIAIFGAVMGLTLLLPLAAYPQKTVPTTWSELRQACRSAGIDSESTDEIIHRCQEQGVSVQEAHAMLSPGRHAATEGLPLKPVMDKIAEGLAKGIPPQVIAQAADQRVTHLASAAEIIESANPKLRVDDVIIPAARAMEIGVAPEVVSSVITAGHDRPARELAATLEACESLHLAGFGSDEIEPIAVDCMNRHLRRVEMRRVVRYATQQRTRGMETNRIRQSLWGNGVEEAQQQNRHREQRGQGPGEGQGPGGPGHGGHSGP
jgi:hypothetical protein